MTFIRAEFGPVTSIVGRERASVLSGKGGQITRCAGHPLPPLSGSIHSKGFTFDALDRRILRELEAGFGVSSAETAEKGDCVAEHGVVGAGVWTGAGVGLGSQTWRPLGARCVFRREP